MPLLPTASPRVVALSGRVIRTTMPRTIPTPAVPVSLLPPPTLQAKIVAMTCTHAALKRREFLQLAFKYDNLLMEEAAQILEIETFIPMLLQVRGRAARGGGAGARLRARESGATEQEMEAWMDRATRLPPPPSVRFWFVKRIRPHACRLRCMSC